MSDLSKRASAAYRKGTVAETLARQSPAYVEKSREAAEFFAEAARLTWRVYLELIPSTEYAIRGRDAWENARNVEALDWYRHSVKEGHRVLEMADRISPRTNPAAVRIMRANARVTVANSLKALARNLVQQSREGKFDLYDFGRDEGLQFFNYLLQAYETAAAGAAENPEGEHIIIPLQADRANLEKFLRGSVPHWGVVYARFSDNKTVCALMAHINPKAYAMAKYNQVLQQNKAARLWAMGSFWLFAIVVVAGVIALIGSVFSPWVVLGAIVGLEVTFALVGAFILRSTESLNQANFLKLVAMAAKLQFRSLLAGQQKPEQPEGTEEASANSE